MKWVSFLSIIFRGDYLSFLLLQGEWDVFLSLIIVRTNSGDIMFY